MAECRLTSAAEYDIEMIWAHTAQQWGVGQANRYTDVLTATFAELAQSPKSAPAIVAEVLNAT
ncbi:MAG: type II toxin-antitoxin system RelE/ParE family toxin [Sulfuriferula sp.]